MYSLKQPQIRELMQAMGMAQRIRIGPRPLSGNHRHRICVSYFKKKGCTCMCPCWRNASEPLGLEKKNRVHQQRAKINVGIL